MFQAVKKVLIPQSGSKDGKYLKMLVELDSSQVLIRDIVKMNAVNLWVDFKYERCPDFCYSCRTIGYTDRYCAKMGKDLTILGYNQFGRRMRAATQGPNSQ
ncbi:hypothetical protein ACH5RR_008502 [Cinchona calisaya]|uniref:Zinc knuckle CX2CX4HX4C domain-containing protein n=1 Tax=Cinchona calisaya TaxID=153742 RepID=A0ABD3AF62_9GENT